MMVENLSLFGALTAFALPFVAFLISFVVLNRKLVVGLHGLGAIGSLVYVFSSSTKASNFIQYSWLSVGNYSLQLGISHVPETAFLVGLVGLVGFLVILFSIEYMSDDSNPRKYYSELSLFIFSMQALLLAPSAFQFFLGWEMMGLCSYLLIGHYRNKASAQDAATKAWMYNRVGDAGFIAGLGLMLYMVGNTDFHTFNNLFENGNLPLIPLTIIGFCWLLAAVGKSAQFPLLGWLPDAMTGPTPVSALIHAATMVISGLVLIIRIYPTLDTIHLQTIMFLGSITALWGGIQAIRSTDLKRLLAWSTVSQLGWLVLTLGAGGKGAALVHILVHGIFKSGLFLIAGTLIYLAHKHKLERRDVGNMIWMKGIGRFYPILRWSGLLLVLSLSGFPFTAGFLSKEWTLDVLLIGLIDGNLPASIWIPVLVVPFLTAWYAMKIYLFVLHPAPSVTSNPLNGNATSLKISVIPLILAILSLFILVSLNPLSLRNGYFFIISGENVSVHTSTLILSITLLIAGWGLAIAMQYSNLFSKEGNSPILKQYSSWIHPFLSWIGNLNRAEQAIEYSIQNGILKPLNKIAKVLQTADYKGIDGFVRLLTLFKIILSSVSAWVDKSFVDRLVSISSTAIINIGPKASEIKGGQLQQYIGLLATILLIGLAIIAFFILR